MHMYITGLFGNITNYITVGVFFCSNIYMSYCFVGVVFTRLKEGTWIMTEHVHRGSWPCLPNAMSVTNNCEPAVTTALLQQNIENEKILVRRWCKQWRGFRYSTPKKTCVKGSVFSVKYLQDCQVYWKTLHGIFNGYFLSDVMLLSDWKPYFMHRSARVPYSSSWSWWLSFDSVHSTTNCWRSDIFFNYNSPGDAGLSFRNSQSVGYCQIFSLHQQTRQRIRHYRQSQNHLCFPPLSSLCCLFFKRLHFLFCGRPMDTRAITSNGGKMITSDGWVSLNLLPVSTLPSGNFSDLKKMFYCWADSDVSIGKDSD